MPNKNTNINIFGFHGFHFLASQSFARFLFVFIFLAEGDSLKSLLIAASKIAKSFKLFPIFPRASEDGTKVITNISVSPAVTTGYYQTTMDQGAFMDKIVKRRKGPSQVPRPQNTQRKCQKILLFRHFLKKQINLFQIFIAYCLYIFHILYRAICFAWIKF